MRRAPPRKYLSREERALCRFLQDHNIPCARIAAEFHCSESTVKRLKKEEHHSAEYKSEDAKFIGSRAQDILPKLQNSLNSSGVIRPSTRKEPDDQRAFGFRDPGSRLLPRSITFFCTYLFTVLTRFSRQKVFLSDFYDTNGTLQVNRLTRGELRSTLAERFSAMSVVKRFIPEDALWVWMPAVEIVRREELGREFQKHRPIGDSYVKGNLVNGEIRAQQ
ncbi:hypothetical protein C8R43DRAFT_958732 [Mycena crocata]|nr:hypothetical protein C8R43DRAFT_958732 [Mycena crocata]